MSSVMVLHQHTNNFGDDVAGSALVLGLLELPQVERVDVHYIWHRGGGGLPVDDERVRHHKLDLLAGRADNRPLLAILTALSVLSPRLLRGPIRQLIRDARAADVVFVAPAGSNIGIYKDWTYLLSLAVLVRAGIRPVFCQNTIAKSGSRPFDLVAREVLRRSTVHVRETRSYDFVRSLGVACELGVDTALMAHPPARRTTSLRPHLTVVPTRLGTWHRDHQDFDDDQFLSQVLPQGIVSFARDAGLDVHVLAHLYGPEREDDALTLVRDGLIAAGCTVEIVQPRDYVEYWQDLADAQVVVSMRYHGLILSGAALTPCVALSYENKMREAAAYLGVSDLLIDVEAARPAQIDALLRSATAPDSPAGTALGTSVPTLREVAHGPLAHVPHPLA